MWKHNSTFDSAAGFYNKVHNGEKPMVPLESSLIFAPMCQVWMLYVPVSPNGEQFTKTCSSNLVIMEN